jgi:hypothetical protein
MFKQLVASILVITGLKKIPEKDGKLNFSKEHTELLKKTLGDADFAKLEKMAEEEFKNDAKLKDLEANQKEALGELQALLQQSGIESAQLEHNTEQRNLELENGETPKAKEPTMQETIAELKTLINTQAEQIKILSGEPEETVMRIIKGSETIKKIEHSATHLFGSTHAHNAFEDRPWNQRLRTFSETGVMPSAETYTTTDITRIKEDFDDFFAQDLSKTVSFLRGLDRLPKHWGLISGIQDQLRYSKLFSGEVSQSRKAKWMPKGKFTFQPEIAQVYDKQIDLTFKGSELQKHEKTWMGRYNQEGASPFKMSFIEMLMMEVRKTRLEEDQTALVKGVYVPTEDDAELPGLAMHSVRGLLKLIREAQLARKYKAASIGKPTHANIVDYVQAFVQSIPKYWRDLPGMILYMDQDWAKAYHARREQQKGTNTDYKGDSLYVDRQDNIRIEPMFFDLGDFMFITTDDNIDRLEGNRGEEEAFSAEKEKRDLHVFADYRIGIHVHAFGYQYPLAEEMTFDKQMFFSNDVEIKLNNYVQIPENSTIPSVKHHNELQVAVNTQATAITDIADMAVGDVVYIYGAGNANASTIVNAGNFDLDGAITLKENTVIKLYKRGAGDIVEIYRNENLVEPDFEVLEADATLADASVGVHRFVTQANTGVTALTDIENAVDSETYILEGGSDVNPTTVAKEGKFSRITAAITLEDGNFLKVIYNGSKFIELDRLEA